MPPKAQSVTVDGQEDGFLPPAALVPQILEGGYTRLLFSAPAERLPALHRDLLALLSPPWKLLYVRLTDRARGQLPRPEQLVAVDLAPSAVLSAIDEARRLVYQDGRHQLWVRGARGEQLVLDELGLIYAYPDDPSFREVGEAHGLVLDPGAVTMAERDYVRVQFLAEADGEEDRLRFRLGLQAWAG